MPNRNTSAKDFVNAVHRRLVLFRTLEQIGLGLLAASILACGLIGVAIWQSLPTAPILRFCGALGLFIGCGLLIRRWPTRMTAAAEADRQLRLNDLLTSALFSPAIAADDFSPAVLAMADARCQLHAPSEVLLRQLGVRSWTGIALAMAIAVTLAVIPFGPARLQANDANLSVLSANTPAAANPWQTSHGAITPTGDPLSETASSSSMTLEQPANPSAAHPGAPAVGTGNTASTGSGSSSNATQSQQTLQTANLDSHASNPNGQTAGGSNASAGNAGHSEPSSGTRNVTPASPTPTPTWAGSAQIHSQPSTPAVDNRIPPEYRDLVREFFSNR